jgi:WD40 repeat protein
MIGYQDGWARIYESRTGKFVGELDLRLGEKVFSWDGDGVVQGAFLTDEVAIARSMNGLFRDWRQDGTSRIKVDHAVIQSMADAPAGQGVATLSVSIPRVSAFAVAPDSKLVATGGADGTIRLWDGATGKRDAILVNSSTVVGIAFSPDGDLLVGGGEDGSVKIWKLRPDGPAELATIAKQ